MNDKSNNLTDAHRKLEHYADLVEEYDIKTIEDEIEISEVTYDTLTSYLQHLYENKEIISDLEFEIVQNQLSWLKQHIFTLKTPLGRALWEYENES